VRVEDIIDFLREKNASKFGSEAFEILVNGTNVRGLMGVKTELKDGDVVSLIPIVEGG
jgi:molybdopterin converting factor small subunit